MSVGFKKKLYGFFSFFLEWEENSAIFIFFFHGLSEKFVAERTRRNLSLTMKSGTERIKFPRVKKHWKKFDGKSWRGWKLKEFFKVLAKENEFFSSKIVNSRLINPRPNIFSVRLQSFWPQTSPPGIRKFLCFYRRNWLSYWYSIDCFLVIYSKAYFFPHPSSFVVVFFSILTLSSTKYAVNVMMRHLLYLKNEPFFYEID